MNDTMNDASSMPDGRTAQRGRSRQPEGRSKPPRRRGLAIAFAGVLVAGASGFAFHTMTAPAPAQAQAPARAEAPTQVETRPHALTAEQLKAAGGARVQQIQAQSAPAEAADRVQETFGTWAVNCSTTGEGKLCAMSQTLSARRPANAEQQGNVFAVAMSLAGGSADALTARVVTPIGTLLDRGVTLTLAGNDVAIPYRRCQPRRCFAPFAASAEQIEAMRGGESMTVTYVAPSGRPLQLEISLSGFSAAHDFIRQYLG